VKDDRFAEENKDQAFFRKADESAELYNIDA